MFVNILDFKAVNSLMEAGLQEHMYKKALKQDNACKCTAVVKEAKSYNTSALC